jgi:hypothetical protein
MSYCPGPLIWFDAGDAAILECSCGYIVITGSFNDVAHARTPVLREGMAP